jgi:hypothetical protein
MMFMNRGLNDPEQERSQPPASEYVKYEEDFEQ